MRVLGIHILGVAVIFAPTTRAICYAPSGEITNDLPCSSDTEHSACCGRGWTCMSNGLCGLPPDSEDDQWRYGRGTCTDEEWRSLSCAHYCMVDGDGNLAGGMPVDQCGAPNEDRYYCPFGPSTWDCDTGQDTFAIGPDVTPVGTAGVPPSSTATSTSSTQRSNAPTNNQQSTSVISSQTTTVSSSSVTENTQGQETESGSSNSEPENNESGSSSNAIAIGAGVGVGVGAAILIIAGAAFVYFRRSRRPAPSSDAVSFLPRQPATATEAWPKAGGIVDTPSLYETTGDHGGHELPGGGHFTHELESRQRPLGFPSR